MTTVIAVILYIILSIVVLKFLPFVFVVLSLFTGKTEDLNESLYESNFCNRFKKDSQNRRKNSWKKQQ